MIFVTLGSQKFQFNRLLQMVDNLNTDEEIFAQTGYSDYKPKNYKFKDFLSRDEYKEFIAKSDIVITHAGTGAVIGAVKQGKKVIAVPRLSKYGEHVDDHQVELVKQFSDLDLIEVCLDDDLSASLQKVMQKSYKSYQSNTDVIISDLDSYICKEFNVK